MGLENKKEGNYNEHNKMCWDMPVSRVDFLTGEIELGYDVTCANSIASVVIVNKGVFDMEDVVNRKKMRVTVELLDEKGEE